MSNENVNTDTLSELKFAWESRLLLREDGLKLYKKSKKLNKNINRLQKESKEIWSYGDTNIEAADATDRTKWVSNYKSSLDSSLLEAESNILEAKRDIIFFKGQLLQLRASKIWAEAVLEVWGDIKLEWKNWNEEKRSYECHLENGEIYSFDKCS